MARLSSLRPNPTWGQVRTNPNSPRQVSTNPSSPRQVRTPEIIALAPARPDEWDHAPYGRARLPQEDLKWGTDIDTVLASDAAGHMSPAHAHTCKPNVIRAVAWATWLRCAPKQPPEGNDCPTHPRRPQNKRTPSSHKTHQTQLGIGSRFY